jgi:hypothetical protein
MNYQVSTMAIQAPQAAANPQNGTLKTVGEFLMSPQPLSPIDAHYAPYPSHMVGGSPYPPAPGHQSALYDRASAPVMSLKTLFGRTYGSTAR